jgi:hypothetical protein
VLKSSTGYGLPFASLQNEYLRLDYLTTTGPRVVGLYFGGGKDNLLASTPEVHWETPHGEFFLRGGHRLWIAPENPFFTPPEESVTVTQADDRVVLHSAADVSGIEKEIAVRLEANRVHLLHRVTWHGSQPLELAPWAITQLRIGGLGILPLPAETDGFAPNRNLVLWSYSRLDDDRLKLYDDMILVHGRSVERALKVGAFNAHGWIACALGDALFVKRFPVREGRLPDLGCNAEMYVKDVCLELETLGPLVTLQTGEFVTHEETWQVFAGEYPATLEGARRVCAMLSE